MNTQDYEDILEPFDKLIEIEITGEKRLIPENNTLLRGFQFLSPETVSFGDFCWNGECANCQIRLEDGAGKEKIVLDVPHESFGSDENCANEQRDRIIETNKFLI